MYGFLRDLSTGVFLRGCAWMSVTDNNTENHEVVLRELSWLPGNKLARFSATETLEPAPVNLENVTQKLHSMKTPPGKTQSRRVSQWQLAPSEIATSVWKLELQRGKWQKAALSFQYKNYCKGSN